MNYRLKFTSSLEKIFFKNFDALKETNRGSMLKNEIYSFQLAVDLKTEEDRIFEACRIEITSQLKKYISVYATDYVANEIPCASFGSDDDYISTEPGLFPDPLRKLENGEFRAVSNQVRGLWFSIEPDGEIYGDYPIDITLYNSENEKIETVTYQISIINALLPEQKLISTGWFHGDCIASLHNTEIGSDLYYEIVNKYMKVYAKFGHNMILTPIFTPPLDTAIGKERPTNQLADVYLDNGKYSFGFEKLEKWIDLCTKNNIKYFEISHLFTQWGAKNAPKIKAYVNGEYKTLFGWHTDGLSEEYKEFLNALLPELKAFLSKKGILENCYFHVSDEPTAKDSERYKKAKDIISAHISPDRLFDALSDVGYYKDGIIKKPIVAIDHIKPFMQEKSDGLWAYYCMAQRMNVANRFIAQPSYRSRILGYQLYKNNIEGFLQWGFNFWYTAGSQSVINPYCNTTAGTAFQGGDPFVVYPLNSNGTVVCSLRLYVFNESLQDMRALEYLENLIGKDEVLKLLTDLEGFDVYPKNAEYILTLREKINEKIKTLTE